MKLLLLLMLCLSCQKDIMPEAKDLYDIDEDGIRNEYDLQPQIVDAPEFYPISGRISFSIEDHFHSQYGFETNLGLENYYASNLLKKNLPNDFFAEAMTVDILNNDIFPEIETKKAKYKINLIFEPSPLNPESIYITYKDREFFLSKWSENIEIEISSIMAKDILEKKAKISFEYKGFDKKRIKAIRDANKRVIHKMHDGIEVFYVTKNTTIPEVLTLLGLQGANDLNKVNLYQTQTSEKTSIWAKQHNDTIFIIEDSLQNIYQSFLTNFEKHDLEVLRVNGELQKTINLSKAPHASVILKFNGVKSNLEFSESRKDTRVGGGGREGSHDTCRSYYRKISKTTESIITTTEFTHMLNNNMEYQSLFKSNDEIAFTDGLTKLSITNDHLDPLSFVTLGRYSSECKETSDNRTANEGYLKVMVEAYIEKN